MSISDKTRKLLWGRASGRCALCRVELLMEGGDDSESVIGEECHIVAQSPGGPRYRPSPPLDVAAYDNLILLCRNHHKLVDDQPETFTEPVLRRVKSNHES